MPRTGRRRPAIDRRLRSEALRSPGPWRGRKEGGRSPPASPWGPAGRPCGVRTACRGREAQVALGPEASTSGYRGASTPHRLGSRSDPRGRTRAPCFGSTRRWIRALEAFRPPDQNRRRAAPQATRRARAEPMFRRRSRRGAPRVDFDDCRTRSCSIAGVTPVFLGPADLADGEHRIIPVPDAPAPWRSLIVACVAGRYVAYWNVCRHLPVPLDSGVGHLGGGPEWICATHGARFRPADGYCVEGPCQGAHLHPVRVEVDGQGMWWWPKIP